MHHFFYRLYQIISTHRWLSVIISLVFMMSCLWIISKITFDEDITQMLPQKAMQNETAKIWKNVRFQDKIAVIISKKNTATEDDLIQTATAFLDTIAIANEYIESIQGYTSEEVMLQTMHFVHDHLPLYLQPSDYDSITLRITQEGIRKQMMQNFDRLTSGSGSFFQDFIVRDPLNFTFLALPHLQNISVDDNFIFQDGYLFTKDKNNLVLFIQSKWAGSETKENQKFVALLEDIQSILNDQYKSTEIHYFGSPFIAVANAHQIQKDIITTISISMTALMVILMLYYRKVIIPILIFLPSVFGGITAMAIMYFITDRLSAISISIAAILLGITIDYALHFLTHSKTISEPKSLFKEITRPLFMSSFTTAIAFLCLLFVDAKALNDLGWFAFIAVMASVFFTLIILPHIYRPKQGLQASHFIDQLAQYPFEKNRLLIAICLFLIIGSAFTYHRVTFDQDLTKINFFPEEQARNQQLIEPQNQQTKSIYVVSYGDNLDEVLLQSKKVQKIAESDAEVLGINSIGAIVLDKKTQEERLNLWKSFWQKHDWEQIEKQVVQASIDLGFVEETFVDFAENWSKEYPIIDLNTFQKINAQLVQEFISEKNGLYQQSTVIKIPQTYIEEFINKIKPLKNTVVIVRQALNEELLGHLVTDFNGLVNISFIAVLLILWYFFRRIEWVLLASIPIALTGWITAGIMGALGIPFNIFSSIVCTLIFGHGVDFTIFMTSALQKQYTYGKNEMTVYRTSIILAVLTTILAIGALIFAKHPALRSISSIALIGVSTAVLTTFVLYPLLFKFFIENRPKKGLSPVSLRIAVESLVIFTIFGLGGMIVSLLLRIFYWIAPLKKQRKYQLMSRIMSWFMRFILRLKTQLRLELISDYPTQNQAFLIANHSSFIDILIMGKYFPKIVYLVNDWVFHSPFFGRFAQMFGFYPVSKGADSGVDHLKNRLSTDFSVVVFPEGTRSYTHEMNRFKKGAFFLAEQLHLPIRPVQLIGANEIIPKGDYMIYDGPIYIYVEPTIAVDDQKWGKNYSEKNKNISRTFKTHHQKLRQKILDENYYKQKLFLNYLYKEHEIIRTVKKDFHFHKKAYLELHHLLDTKANMVHYTQDWGQTDFLMLKYAPLLKIRTFNPLEDRRDVSKTSYILKCSDLKYWNQWDEENTFASSILLISHTDKIDSLSLEKYSTIICFLSPKIKINGKKCVYNSKYIQMYESE